MLGNVLVVVVIGVVTGRGRMWKRIVVIVGVKVEMSGDVEG